MTSQYYCKNKDRWKKVKENNSINGIDYLEIASVDQTIIDVYFLHELESEMPASPPESPPANLVLSKENVFIEGGVRINNICVEEIIFDSIQKNLLHVIVDKTGDFSNYTLKIGNSQTDKNTPPPGFDIQLSSVEFSFKINCPSDFDCKEKIICPSEKDIGPVGNYLAKDFSSFKRLMLDRLSIIMPQWKERNAADQQLALVELFAYIGDQLSYFQDAVATEAYLHTARRRVSLKRHARLLDYFVHDGCNARVWVQIEVEPAGNADKASIKKGTLIMTHGSADEASISKIAEGKFINEKDPVIFETMHEILLNSNHNLISFYTWQDNDCCLPKGSTSATLIDKPGQDLNNGDVLIFEELYSPSDGKKVNKNIDRRHAVRIKSVEKDLTDTLTNTPIVIIHWYDQDALPFSLCLTSSEENEDNTIGILEKSVARGNVVLADHGYTRKGQKLDPESATDEDMYYPNIQEDNITNALPYDHFVDGKDAVILSFDQSPRQALPAIKLSDKNDQEYWLPQRDLLGSNRFSKEFVVEAEKNGDSFIRFGDDILGKKPPNGFNPSVEYRIGNGKEGNIGAEAINTIVLDGGGILKVRNPMAASGGCDSETMEEIRQFAPQAFRYQERAVTESDYIEKTELYTDVQKAKAKFYWTGSWYTVYIIIDRKEGKEVDQSYKQDIITHLEKYRMAGYDLEIRSPNYVPLYIILRVCVKPGYFKNVVKESLLEVFSNYRLADGSMGFFHPDNFTFGQSVYLSSIYQKAMEVEGVGSIEVKEFKKWAKKPANEIENGLIQASELEIIRLDNDPNFPENGKIDFEMLGGL